MHAFAGTEEPSPKRVGLGELPPAPEAKPKRRHVRTRQHPVLVQVVTGAADRCDVGSVTIQEVERGEAARGQGIGHVSDDPHKRRGAFALRCRLHGGNLPGRRAVHRARPVRGGRRHRPVHVRQAGVRDLPPGTAPLPAGHGQPVRHRAEDVVAGLGRRPRRGGSPRQRARGDRVSASRDLHLPGARIPGARIPGARAAGLGRRALVGASSRRRRTPADRRGTEPREPFSGTPLRRSPPPAAPRCGRPPPRSPPGRGLRARRRRSPRSRRCRGQRLRTGALPRGS